MKSFFALVAAFAALGLGVNALADCGNCGVKDACAQKCTSGTCSGEQCSSTDCAAGQCDSSKGCPVAAAMERLPKMTYAVGDKTTGCPKEAAKLAEGSGSQIQFCVAEKKYDSKSDAQDALVEATEKFVAAFAEPHTCPKSGQCTLAGQVQKCEKTAARTAELMQQAMAKVKLTYLVGDEECHCPVEAGKLAEKSGKEKVFVVGDQKTRCEKTARLNLARAKYKAAIQAMFQAQAATAKPDQTAGG